MLMGISCEFVLRMPQNTADAQHDPYSIIPTKMQWLAIFDPESTRWYQHWVTSGLVMARYMLNMLKKKKKKKKKLWTLNYVGMLGQWNAWYPSPHYGPLFTEPPPVLRIHREQMYGPLVNDSPTIKKHQNFNMSFGQIYPPENHLKPKSRCCNIGYILYRIYPIYDISYIGYILYYNRPMLNPSLDE